MNYKILFFVLLFLNILAVIVALYVIDRVKRGDL